MEGYPNQNQTPDDRTPDTQVSDTADYYSYGQTEPHRQPGYAYTDANTGTYTGSAGSYTGDAYGSETGNTGAYTGSAGSYAGNAYGNETGNTSSYTGNAYGNETGNTGSYAGNETGNTSPYIGNVYGGETGNTGSYTRDAYGNETGYTESYTRNAYENETGNTESRIGNAYANESGSTDTYARNVYESVNGSTGTYTGVGPEADPAANTAGADSYDGMYRPYEEPVKPKKNRGFGKKLMRYAALGLTFGVVAAVSFAGTNHFFGNITGKDAESEEEVLSGGNLNIAETTEAADSDSGQPDSSRKLAAEGAVTDVSDIVDQVMPSIVSITTIARTQVPSFFFGGMQEYESEGCGSGIIISQDEENLYIATNNHVVEGAETLTVLFADDSTVSAQVKGTDPSSDLAVVSVALNDIESDTRNAIRTATFGDSGTLKVGQTAIAIGNALGYGQSVTTGVISALDREVTVTNEMDGSASTNELLQTDAAINPGNSGGALLNLNGEVIGINSVKYAETSVEGMGYAIPVETAIPIIRQLITREVVDGAKSAYLGISGVDVTQAVSDTYQMPQGVYVAQVVEGSGAVNAGIMQGDIITRFDGRNIKSSEEMEDLMQYISSGETIEVTIQRAVNGEYVEQTLEVTLGSKK